MRNCIPTVAKRPDRTGRAGFTLIELLVATTFLLVAIVGAVSSQLAAQNLIRTSNETNLALSDLQSVMERIMLLPRVEIVDPSGDFASGVSIEDYEDLHLESERIVPSYPGFNPGDPVPDALEIRLDVTWSTFDRRQRALQLCSVTTQ